MASKRTNRGEEVLRREYRDDRGIDDAHPFAGAIAVGNDIMMEAKRTDEKGCGWTDTRVAPLGSSLQLNTLDYPTFSATTHQRTFCILRPCQEQAGIYTNQSFMMRYNSSYLPSVACFGQSSFIYP